MDIENKIKDDFDIDWKQEIEGAAIPSINEICQKNSDKVKKFLITTRLWEQINIYGFETLEKMADAKAILSWKMFDGVSKITKALGSEFKFLKIGKFSVIPLDLIFLGKDLYDVWTNEDSSLNDKLYDTGKAVASTAGSIGGGILAGAAAGSVFGPVGTIVGVLVGSIIGGIGGKIIYDYAMDSINQIIKQFAGIIGLFSSGGVEFTQPREIEGFKKNFIFERTHFIAFEYNSENNFNVNEIIDLVNTKFLLDNIKVKSINEIYDTILKEISYGFLYNKQLPQISLNFNKDGLLYSIMDTFYKNTLTGNILTFLDYYLKSYVNGGFFKEEFIFEWQKNKNTNRDFLQNHIIDFKKYLYELTHDPNKINYCSIYDLGQNSEYEHNYVSAFRIIGNIGNCLKYCKNVIFPDCSYFSQFDFFILPAWQSIIDLEKDEKQKSQSLIDAHKIMNIRVKYLMNKIPFLKPYFEILKMITFAIHYLPNVQKCGLFPIFKDAIQNNNIGKKYCKSIPTVFPPLPVRKKTNLEIKITIKELLELFKINNYWILNEFIIDIFYKTEENRKLDKIKYNQKYIFDKIKEYVQQKILNALDEHDKYMKNLFSDEKLAIKDIEKTFIDKILYYIRLEIAQDYFEIYNILDKQDNKNYKPKCNEDYIYKVTSFNDLKKEVEEISSLLYIYLKYSEEPLKNEKKEVEKLIEKKSQELTNNLEGCLNKNEIKNIKNEGKEKIILIIKNDYEKLIDKLKTTIDNLENKLIFNNIINEGSIKKYPIIQEETFILKLNYVKSVYEEKNENKKTFNIRGGCFPSINNHMYLSEFQKITKTSYVILINNLNKTKEINHKNYYVVKTELRNGFIYGGVLEYLTKNIDINRTIMELSCVLNKKLSNNIKDFSGNSIGFYKSIKNSQLNVVPTEEELNTKNYFGERPEFYLIFSGNSSYIKKILSLPYSNFTSQLEGGLTPLSSSLIGGEKKVVDILLSKKYINKNGNLNNFNELGLTYLHLAVNSNMDTAVIELINNGADISLKTKKEENTPIHLMGILARNEIIMAIYKNRKFINNINNIRPDGKTALHFISSNSILGTKLILLSGGNSNITDSLENTPAKYAFFSGRFDIYDELLKSSNLKKEISLIKDIENMVSNSYKNRYYQFDEKHNNYNLFDKLIKSYENNDMINSKNIINRFKENNAKLSEEQIYQLIELSCKNRNIKLLITITEIIL